MAGFYRIVRVRPNGTEQVIRDIAIEDVTVEQQRRAEAFADTELRGNQHYRLYSSDDAGVVTADDVIWDSDINLP